MSERADTPPLNCIDWSDLGVGDLLPTGTVTLLLADVENSTRLWESEPDEMTAAFARLDRTLSDVVAAHHGVRPVEQGEGDSFVIAFARASDAVACALALQRAPLAPIRLRIGLHSGEVQLRDEGNYIGATINRTARIRDLAHGGQTVLSGTAEALAADRLPADAWLGDLGNYPLRGIPRPERVVQLCHPDIRNDFPPLRTSTMSVSHNIPAQLTNFIGRQAEMTAVCQIVLENRFTTLTGAGGAGKTRLAVEATAVLATEFGDGVWCVDLAPITNPAVVPVAVARTFGLPDQPGQSTIDTLVRFLGDRTILLLLDNCEHLLDVCGQLAVQLLNACPHLTILATSREPLGIAGEVIWRVPSLSLADEAVALFTDRARRARPDFCVTDENAALVTEICRRLDGMPLAIELAAARVRALSLTQMVDSLHDRFRLLTGGARTAVRRQQTLRASVDWSHALLTEPERILLRRLAVFMGGFDFGGAQAVCASSDVEGYQVLDQLLLLVDKSLVVAEDVRGAMRYRLLETVRQYALEKLCESSEADDVRTRHRDYYTATAARLQSAAESTYERLIEWAEVEIDNLRAAYAWSQEIGDFNAALRLVSSLANFWSRRGRLAEGLAGFDAILTDVPHEEVEPAVWVRAVADHSILAASAGRAASRQRAHDALAAARQLDDPGLVALILTACGMLALYTAEVAQPFFVEAIEHARVAGAQAQLAQIRNLQAVTACFAGDPINARDAAEEARCIADSLGDGFTSRNSRVWLGIALWMQGEFDDAGRALASLADDAATANELTNEVNARVAHGLVLAYQGQAAAARAAAEAAERAAAAMGGFYGDTVHAIFAYAALADGDAGAAKQACETAWRHTVPLREIFIKSTNPMAEAALACGDLALARRWTDETVAVVPGWFRMAALTVRAFVALAQGETEQAERDAHSALTIVAQTRGYLRLPDILECLSHIAHGRGSDEYAARILGAAEAIRQHAGQVRLPVYNAGFEAAIHAVRDALGQADFDTAWAEGAALSAEEAIAYAQRGRGERKRPSNGWASLTPTELDVVRLVSEGLSNNDIAARLFVSPRTVQTHLTHVYTKLGVKSRVQLVQEATRQR
ncbi:helix-turn-helix transcriptional regulator [Mycobacterium colombiense]|uniref:Transcriptional regulator n=2 Tax=Mycobacterium colombiense TaxID=339268 RepID=A0A853LWS9_9MYCO|nr:LuxR family transcriptional regulator [Mycobacterium colombiense]OBJ17895.1 transcriptional regulator [Mycobacterium colombiense]OBJ56983.1 transcriptional regulator [Mycobacterium colombiense]